MKIKRIIFRTIVRALEYEMRIWSVKSCEKINFPPQKSTVEIYTISFNNPNVIRLQINKLREFIKDDFTHIVADNSTSKSASEEIKAICKNAGIAYIRLPKNFLGKISPSYSHAGALNWVFHKITKQRAPKFFGFIDHDLFPISEIKIAEKLAQQPIYGALREREDGWYLSAIMSFFKFEFVKNRRVDFMPITPKKSYLDTGGGNWTTIFSKMEKENLTFVKEKIVNFRGDGENRHQDQLEFFDDCWLHTINGSYWKLAKSKEADLEQLIEKFSLKK